MAPGSREPAHDRLTAAGWLRHHARHRPAAIALTTWDDGEIRRRTTFGELARQVDAVARALRGPDAAPGHRVVLVLPNDETFAAVLLAVIGTGLVAVPAPGPRTMRAEAFGQRLRAVVRDCRPALVITTEAWRDTVRTTLEDYAPRVRIRTWEELPALAAAVPERGGAPDVRVSPRTPAFLQYTSGSTGSPKGVVIDHRALRASCRQAAARYRESPADVAVTWVPLSHDMGLITGVLRPLFSGYESVLLPTERFARRPAEWLLALTACRGTLSSAPDFAYDLCARRTTDDEAAALDLRAWRVARSAGEVVRAATADRFTARFAAAGFRAESLCPSYGMAEATLTVTATTPELPPLRLAAGTEALRAGRAVRAAPGTPSTTLLSSGVPLPGTRVRIGDGRHDEHRVGEIHIRGPQLFRGYWRRPLRRSRWHPTGDLGFLDGGHLFVLGRTDDVLVHRGRNFHPADVAAACAGVPGLRAGRCAAFTVGDGTAGDLLCLVSEVTGGPGAPSPAHLAAEARRRLAQVLDLYVAEVVLLPAGGLPVTTSGKVRISETRQRFERGDLPVLWPHTLRRTSSGHREERTT
ncbi:MULTISPECIES: AMP-binding protein [unclassified Streptomyces]|uniref:AMP-binding protein n=1 Tax=unclassified Streptomyces TaxID=2593676 RepID=UPI003316F691